MATSQATFQQKWRIGRRVQEAQAPHRPGVIKARHGTGAGALIIVALTGAITVTYHPAQLTPL